MELFGDKWNYRSDDKDQIIRVYIFETYQNFMDNGTHGGNDFFQEIV